MFLILATSCGANDDPLSVTPHNLSTVNFERVQLPPEPHKICLATQTLGSEADPWLAKAEQAFEQSPRAPILVELDYDLANGESLDAASFCLYLALVTQLLLVLRQQ